MKRIYTAVAAIGMTMGFVLSTNAIASGPTHDELSFRVLLDDKEIGQHTFKISKSGDSTVVSITADFDVKVFFFNAYSYLHRNTETWQDGCLLQIDSSTDANGTRFAVNGEKAEGSFELSTLDRSYSLDNTCIMTFAYWDRAFLSQPRLLNAQTGDYLEVQTEPLGRRRFELTGRGVWAEGFRISDENSGLDIKVWYQETSNKWIGLESKVSKGKTLRYEPSTAENLASGIRPVVDDPSSG